jgi:hypothetical protein
MKTKETIDTTTVSLEKLNTKTKPKSLRPMRSMVAVRSLKPKAIVATMTATKSEELQERN